MPSHHPQLASSLEDILHDTHARTHAQSNEQISTAVPILACLRQFSRASSTITPPPDTCRCSTISAPTTCLGVTVSWRLTSQNRSPDTFCDHVDVKHAGNCKKLSVASDNNSGMCRLLNIVDRVCGIPPFTRARARVHTHQLLCLCVTALMKSLSPKFHLQMDP